MKNKIITSKKEGLERIKENALAIEYASENLKNDKELERKEINLSKIKKKI